MRSLPVDRNADLVVRVAKQTLDSMNIRIADIVGDAERKEAGLQAQLAQHRSDIAEMEEFIQQRRQEIARTEAELAEITALKQRLRRADSASAAHAPTALAG